MKFACSMGFLDMAISQYYRELHYMQSYGENLFLSHGWLRVWLQQTTLTVEFILWTINTVDLL